MAAAAAKKLSLKLLIDKKTKRVLFAEAGKDVVDFLFSLLSLPVATVIKLLNKTKMVGCIGNLYQSVENLDDTYIIQPSSSKELLLKPKVSAGSLGVPLLTTTNETTPINPGKFYSCASGKHHSRYTNDPKVVCPSCGSCSMSTELTYVPSSAGNTPAAAAAGGVKGYVKEVVTYMVMDDLSVTPMSTISSITLLHKFNVENVGSLEEKVVSLGMNEGLELLKASLHSKNVLSKVFLGIQV